VVGERIYLHKKNNKEGSVVKHSTSKAISLFVVFLSIFLVTTAQAYYPKTEKNTKGIYPQYPKVDYGSGQQAKLIKRGEYLVKAGDCIACHTKSGGKPFAGGLPMKTPFGTFFSPNLTPDKETGIGKWGFKDFVRAMHEGKSPSGSNYFPVFPYIYFTQVSKQDLRAIWAYLQALPAVKHKNKKPDVPFPFNVRFAQYGWKLLFFYRHDGQFKYNANQTAQWNRGKYLVDGLGHCSMCHTPLNFLGGPKRKYYLTGAFIGGFWAPNITRYGLQSASRVQVTDVFKKGELINQAGPVAGPMAEVMHDSLKYLSNEDLLAIATYLKTVKSQEPLRVGKDAKASRFARGKKVYFAACHICHQEGMMGAPRIGDAANWQLRLSQRSLPTLYRHVINGYNQMPVKGACVTCSDEDLEAAVDYLLQESMNTQQLRKALSVKPKEKPNLLTGKEIYTQYCAACHDKGALGAPKLGDKKVWKPILEKNFDVLIRNTLKGGHKMPPRGGCKNCTTSEVISAIKYMAQEGSDGDYRLW
jgi:cytochrome c5